MSNNMKKIKAFITALLCIALTACAVSEQPPGTQSAAIESARVESISSAETSPEEIEYGSFTENQLYTDY